MTPSRQKWMQIQAVIGNPQDGIPGPRDNNALLNLSGEAMNEYQASKAKQSEEIGFMDGSSIVRRADGVIEFYGGMQVNADGSPHAYHPQGKGLDYLANAGKP